MFDGDQQQIAAGIKNNVHDIDARKLGTAISERPDPRTNAGCVTRALPDGIGVMGTVAVMAGGPNPRLPGDIKHMH